MVRIVKLIVLNSSLTLLTILLVSVSGAPTIKEVPTSLTDIRQENEKTLKQIDHEFANIKVVH